MQGTLITLQPLDHLPVDSPKRFRSNFFQFLQPDPLSATSQKKDEQLKFIPYVQERDGLGNLLSPVNPKRKYHLPHSPLKSSSPVKFKSFDNKYSLFQEDLPEQDFNFDVFRVSPKISNSPMKKSLHRILKPLDPIDTRKTEPTQSPCFRTIGRVDPPLKEVPSVGYYSVSDSLLHKSSSEVTFPRKKKLLLLPDKKTSKASEEEVDIIKSYNKVYQKGMGIPDFMKQTDRLSHFRQTFKSEKEVKKEDLYQYEYTKTKPAFGKDVSSELSMKLKQSFEISQKNLPLPVSGLHDKFGLMKKKYNINFVKLK